MKYKVNFPNKKLEGEFNKNLLKISQVKIQDEIMDSIEKLGEDPRPYGRKLFKRLKPPIQLYQYIAQFRLRVGDYRILYDIDDSRKIVWVFTLRKRSEKTYK